MHQWRDSQAEKQVYQGGLSQVLEARPLVGHKLVT